MIPITPEMILFGIDVVRRGAQAVKELIDRGQQSGELTADQANAFRAQLNSDAQSDAYKTDTQKDQASMTGEGGGAAE